MEYAPGRTPKAMLNSPDNYFGTDTYNMDHMDVLVVARTPCY